MNASFSTIIGSSTKSTTPNEAFGTCSKGLIFILGNGVSSDASLSPRAKLFVVIVFNVDPVPVTKYSGICCSLAFFGETPICNGYWFDVWSMMRGFRLLLFWWILWRNQSREPGCRAQRPSISGFWFEKSFYLIVLAGTVTKGKIRWMAPNLW